MFIITKMNKQIHVTTNVPLNLYQTTQPLPETTHPLSETTQPLPETTQPLPETTQPTSSIDKKRNK
jgi:hypothetical protein